MTALQVKGKMESGPRAGGYALSLLSMPLNIGVLQALAEEPKPLADLRREVGSPPQTTLRKHLRTLTQLGVLEKRRQNDFPGSLDYELTSPGRRLLTVAELLEGWLATSPHGPLALGSGGAKSATKALVEGWSTTLLRALAAKPFALTELDRLISGLTYPSLERRLAAMRQAGLVESRRGDGRNRPYQVTRWLRHGVGPLIASAEWERQHIPEETAPLTRIDAETTLLLAAPLLDLPARLSGFCRLAMEVPNGAGPRMTGVMVGVKEGRVASCAARLEGNAAAWASGSASAWLRAVTRHDTDQLEVGGDCQLANALLDGLHGALSGALKRPSIALKS